MPLTQYQKSVPETGIRKPVPVPGARLTCNLVPNFPGTGFRYQFLVCVIGLSTYGWLWQVQQIPPRALLQSAATWEIYWDNPGDVIRLFWKLYGAGWNSFSVVIAMVINTDDRRAKQTSDIAIRRFSSIFTAQCYTLRWVCCRKMSVRPSV